MSRFISILGCLLLLQACDSRTPENNYVLPELEVWFHHRSGVAQKALQAQIARFNRLQNNVRINAVILPQGQYQKQVMTAASNNNLPDILEAEADQVGLYARNKYIIPIDKILTDGVREDLIPALIESNIFQGHLYAIGLNSKINRLYFNRDALNAIDITLSNDIAWVREKFYSTIYRLAEHYKDNEIIRIAAPRSFYLETFLPLLEFNKVGERELKQFVDSLDHANNIKFFNFLQQGIQSNFIRFVENDSLNMDGVVVVWTTHAGLGNKQSAKLVGYEQIALPGSYPSGEVIYNDWSIAITRHCTNIQSATRFIEFLLQPEEQLIGVESLGQLPVTESTFKKIMINNGLHTFSGGRRFLAPFHSASPALPEIRRLFNDLIVLLATDVEVRDSVATTKEKMKKILKYFNGNADEAS